MSECHIQQNISGNVNPRRIGKEMYFSGNIVNKMFITM